MDLNKIKKKRERSTRGLNLCREKKKRRVTQRVIESTVKLEDIITWCAHHSAVDYSDSSNVQQSFLATFIAAAVNFSFAAWYSRSITRTLIRLWNLARIRSLSLSLSFSLCFSLVERHNVWNEIRQL